MLFDGGMTLTTGVKEVYNNFDTVRVLLHWYSPDSLFYHASLDLFW